MENTIIADRYALETCDLYKEAHRYVTTYEAKKTVYRKELMENYFTRGEIMVNDYGLIVATAKLQPREDFDVKRFKEDHPELYAKYVNQKTIQPLLVK